MGAFIGWTWLIGIVVAVVVTRARSGIGNWGRIHVFGEGGVGIEWFAGTLMAVAFWPATLAIWLVRGRPEPRIVFNEKAAERRRRMAA